MLKIATPVSHLFEDKLQAQKIIKHSDCLELRERTVHLDFQKEYLFHVDKDLTLAWDRKFKKFFLKILKKKNKLKLITFQSTRCCSGEKIINGRFQLDGNIYTKKKLILNAKKNIHWLRKNLKKKIKIGLENNNYYNAPAYEIITEGNFISEIVIKNKIFFLLDIAHAAITSFNKKIKFQKYLNSLPLHKTIQLHIVDYKIKKILNKKIAIDTHNFPTNRTYKLVSQLLLKYPSIEYLTIEYYKNADRLVKSIKKLKKILKQ
jgi:hypothetical protein